MHFVSKCGEDRFTCLYCSRRINFSGIEEFLAHLRSQHCSKEGGSFICRYGPFNVCNKLPIEGVSDSDYVEHIVKFHLTVQSDSDFGQPTLLKDSRQRAIMAHCSQNMAAVLNDPRKSRRENASFFTRYWGESFMEKSPTPDLNQAKSFDIQMQQYEDYMAKIAKRRRRLGTLKSRETGFIVSKSTVSDVVPAMFFSNKFILQDPQCFEALFLTANLDIVPKSDSQNPEERLKPSKVLLDQLSHHLDSIEIQISRHVSSQSGSFFKAMTSHEDLQKCLSQAGTSVKQMRHGLAIIKENMTGKSLTLLLLKTKRTNFEALLKKLELISTIRQTHTMVQMLLHSGDYLGALELISTTQVVLKVELAHILCFRHLDAQLSELKTMINKMLLEDFLRLLRRETGFTIIQDLNSDDWVNSFDEAGFIMLVLAMCQTREFKFIHILSEEIYSGIKRVVREAIKQGVDPADESSELESLAKSDSALGSLADQMRRLEFDQWIEMFRFLLIYLKNYTTKIKNLDDILNKIFAAAAGKDDWFSFFDDPVRCSEIVSRASFSEQEYLQVVENSKDFLPQSFTYAQERVVRVLVARCKDDFVEKMTTESFLSLNDLIGDFCEFCDNKIMKIGLGNENEPKRKILPLRSCLHALTLRFLTKFHEDRKNKLSHILDLEHWKKADVPVLFQSIIDRYEKDGVLQDVVHHHDSKSIDNANKPASPVLIVANEQYAVIGVGLIMIQLIAQYCQVLDRLPSYSPELLTRLVELLKNFNSRCCQLILGAGAIQLVGLKTISARNLALCSRCLQLILHIVKQVPNYFERHLSNNQKNFIRYFSQTAKDYQDHIDEIFNKLLMIMESQVSGCITKWQSNLPAPSQTFQQFVKQLKRFHGNISDILPSDQLQKLLLRIHDKFKQSMYQRMSELGVDCKQQNSEYYRIACSEFSFYLENLKQIPCCAAVDDTMQDLIDTKL